MKFAVLSDKKIISKKWKNKYMTFFIDNDCFIRKAYFHIQIYSSKLAKIFFTELFFMFLYRLKFKNCAKTNFIQAQKIGQWRVQQENSCSNLQLQLQLGLTPGFSKSRKGQTLEWMWPRSRAKNQECWAKCRKLKISWKLRKLARELMEWYSRSVFDFLEVIYSKAPLHQIPMAP